ncbi:hypothetical protein [Pyxidicoccus sp. MSG2]|uniref:hypothetical protein n=1 Tax=Pyxidicoccus sp. MSG2 TaxID=2996790 RepID=UPI00226FCAB9|nr:hypothetical protein [Pyxidicoccus sp. MSG2]MCY1024048.1 hypothetical protein [Pyxidicoccus sp. MSG2]
MLTLPSARQLLSTLLRASAPTAAPAPSPSLVELRRQGLEFAEWFHSPTVQHALPALKRRYDYLRHVGAELPLWLLSEAPPAYTDCETLWMPTDASVREAVDRNPRMNPIRAQRLAVATLIDGVGIVSEWDESRAVPFVDALLRHAAVISYNGLSFDNVVLGAYGDEARERRLHARTLDLMYWLQWRLKQAKVRKLDDHAWELLRKRKLPLTSLVHPAESVPAVFRRGRPEDVLAVRLYCWHDTELLRDLWEATKGTSMELRSFYAWWLTSQRERLQLELSRGPIRASEAHTTPSLRSFA